MTVDTRRAVEEGSVTQASKQGRVWLAAALAISVVTFVVDLTTPRGVAAGVFPHMIAIALCALSPMRLAPFLLAGLASVFTLTGFALTEGGATQIVLINRIFLVATYWLVAFFVHQKQKAEQGLLQGYAALEDIVEERTKVLSESESRLQLITDKLPALVAYVDAERRYKFANAYYKEVVGVAKDDVIGRQIWEVLGVGGYRIVKPNIDRVLAGEVVRNSLDLPTSNGPRKFRVAYLPDRDADDNVVGFVLLALDVADEWDLERKLEQAQKLKAIGQLSGGIAHDFNNLLGVIIGNLELASSRAGPDAKRFLDAAQSAADRGTSLTHRLLAFARRQPLQSSIVDPNEVVRSMEDLLVRSVGDRIKVEFVANQQLWPALVDAHQLEAAFLNLALNARDAMPEGGCLTIEMQNKHIESGTAAEALGVEAGDYVAISVSDNGMGMGIEALSHAFEPFYTTKEIGKGSGLGLSMVHGFAKQSGGTATIYSEQHVGTTVCIYLPCSASPMNAEKAEDPAEDRMPLGDGGLVLLVDDDAAVRSVVAAMLEQLNYGVETCENGERAIERLSAGDFDILLTDAMLPDGMSGIQLAEAAHARTPMLPVVYMSGYAENAVVRQDRIDSGAELLEKPFRLGQLACALQRVQGDR